MSDHKVCRSCGKDKPISEYNRKKDMKDGYRHTCKECRRLNCRESDLAWYENNKSKKMEYNKEWKAKKRNKLLEKRKKELLRKEILFRKAVRNWFRVVTPSIYT